MATRVTVTRLREMKRKGQKIVMLTAYDYPTARLLDEAGVDVLLVGDSLGMVVLGYESTLPVTLADVLHHTRPVARAAERALVVADLPFMTFQISPEEALRSAGRLMQEGGAHAVKLEGGREVAPTVARLVQAGVPVMGHLGFTPQSVHALGGYRVQGRTEDAARRLLDDAAALVEAGVFAIVLEMVPRQVARLVTERVPVPTIGIGAGPECDGQVLVLHDLLGLYTRQSPRFARRYADLASVIRTAVGEYADDVRGGAFPGPEHSFDMDDAVLERLY
ncbi:3-methyl-2-oxobutanoate hydroxymethyltransferase [Caldinitratiruptor microaerophilus]|uniref:3-methyl-2-oxobutanoate hydroxymethyltransferase n=1 Tax=Caldinitratiruptor microaerophilus TaxID=671077 RepID=A0AA35G8J9_9FIRM|nr:3-methyl-2-oxobutanoate hydroxymethyltransferase [Caldinitratiruptor microaerophilus]BDG60513.1 3-methyl-2-oxobutanoate hydroxymethyltransferase [Caldinitratiruptor microaerophilus]